MTSGAPPAGSTVASGPARSAIAEEMDADPSHDAIAGPYAAAFNHYVRDELGYENDLPYEQIYPPECTRGPTRTSRAARSTTPRQAMRRTPAGVAYGYYDGATRTSPPRRDAPADPGARDIEHAYYEAGLTCVHEPSPATAVQGHRRVRDPLRLSRLMRSLLAFVLLLLGGLLVPTATAAWWPRHGRPQATYVDTVAPLASDPDVQDAVRAKAPEGDDRLARRPPAGPGRPGGAARRAGHRGGRQGPAFEKAWRESNRVAHKQIVGALTGDSDSVGVRSGDTVGAARPAHRCRAGAGRQGRPAVERGDPRTDTTCPIGGTEGSAARRPRSACSRTTAARCPR